MKTASAFEAIINDSLQEALRIRQHCRTETSRREVINNIGERGVTFTNRLSGLDEKDIIGLIGEITMADFAESSGRKMIHIKWREAGTSKSKGIDLIAFNSTASLDVELFEAKHVHCTPEELENSLAQLKLRFKSGLDEFESEKTQLNLSSVIIKLGKAIQIGESARVDQPVIRQYYALMSSTLKEGRYNIHIVVLVDEKYCTKETLRDSTSQIIRPLEIGRSHNVNLSLLQLQALERITNEMCEKYGGAV